MWNGHFQSKCLHPQFVFIQFGDLERCVLPPGNVHSADGWKELLSPLSGPVFNQGAALDYPQTVPG